MLQASRSRTSPMKFRSAFLQSRLLLFSIIINEMEEREKALKRANR
jgi:hypothetical protein